MYRVTIRYHNILIMNELRRQQHSTCLAACIPDNQPWTQENHRESYTYVLTDQASHGTETSLPQLVAPRARSCLRTHADALIDFQITPHVTVRAKRLNTGHGTTRGATSNEYMSTSARALTRKEEDSCALRLAKLNLYRYSRAVTDNADDDDV